MPLTNKVVQKTQKRFYCFSENVLRYENEDDDVVSCLGPSNHYQRNES